MILNFRQDDLIHQKSEPQGSPHYSPFAGLRAKEGAAKPEILVAEVDPDVKEPFWTSLNDVFKSIGQVNPAFDRAEDGS